MVDNHESRPAGNGTASNVVDGDSSPSLPARAAYWLQRAQMLEGARPRRGDFHGNATRDELQARYDRLTADADECRRRAQEAIEVARAGGDLD